jgi:hypothetical protein
MDKKRHTLPIMRASVISILAVMLPIVFADDGPAEEREGVVNGPALDGRQIVPTRVPGDLAGKPVAEVVDALGRATGFSLRLTSKPRESPGRPARAPSFEGGPSFWETLDPLAREARMEIVPRMAIEGRRLELEPLQGLPAPSNIHGAFRCSLIRLIQDRRVLYGDPSGEVPNSTIREPARMAGTNLPSTWEQSHAIILVLAEPRSLIDVQLSGPPRVQEAVDDRGRSLVAASPKLQNPGRYTANRFMFGLEIRVPLDLPEPPGRSIRRFRGTLPVVAWIEQPRPLDVDLTAPEGHSFRGSGVNLELLPANVSSPAGTVRLVMSPEEPDRPASRATVLFEAGPGRMFLDHAAQFEVHDAAGSRIEVDIKTERDTTPETYRVTLTPKPGVAKGLPVRLRYRGLSWSRTDVPFAFDEVPLP